MIFYIIDLWKYRAVYLERWPQAFWFDRIPGDRHDRHFMKSYDIAEVGLTEEKENSLAMRKRVCIILQIVNFFIEMRLTLYIYIN